MVRFVEAPIFSMHVHDYLLDSQQILIRVISFKAPVVFARFFGSEEGEGKAAV